MTWSALEHGQRDKIQRLKIGGPFAKTCLVVYVIGSVSIAADFPRFRDPPKLISAITQMDKHKKETMFEGQLSFLSNSLDSTLYA